MPLAGFGRMPLLFESRRSATAYANAIAAKRPTCVVQVLAYVDKQGILLATVTYPDGTMDCGITLQVLNRFDFSLGTTTHNLHLHSARCFSFLGGAKLHHARSALQRTWPIVRPASC